MYINRQYNIRNSARYNTPGKFVSSGEFQQGPWQQQQQQQHQQQQEEDPSPVLPESMEINSESMTENSTSERPYWMKTKLQGVKKISNKERRRRQNQNLRKLLTPKNAVMVLNEMLSIEQCSTQFKVEATMTQACQRTSSSLHTFCADLNIEGNTYKGYGDNTFTARNSAAEKAIRDIIIKKMAKACGSSKDSQNGEAVDEESLPMIQLASFALYKLFSEWEYEGHKVPQLRPRAVSASEAGEEAGEGAAGGAAAPPKVPKVLPLNAAKMHPCMLLTYMRPHLEYRELAVEGDKPQNMLFTMGVDVDGATYVGKASNKKAARREAAAAACRAVFGVDFEPGAAANVPVSAQ